MNRVLSVGCRLGVRQFATSEARCYKPDMTKIKKLQAHFQEDNGIPVYLKGGPGDKVLFYITTSRFLCRHGSKTWRAGSHYLLRLSSNEPCPPKDDSPCPPNSSLSTPPPPPPMPTPPPCPSAPNCPNAICPPYPDPNNPCNWTPPVCPDPDYPDLTRLKRNQCKFQKDNGIPVHLKGGNADVMLYQITVISTILCAVTVLYKLYLI